MGLVVFKGVMVMGCSSAEAITQLIFYFIFGIEWERS